MRQIKFRAWLPKPLGDNSMRYEVSVSGKEIDNLDKFFTDTSSDGCVWMQFTGLLDKNGVKIFEGDLINLKLHIMSDRNDLCEVIYKDGGFKAISIENEVSLSDFYTRHGEVVGNIYEKYELIN